MKNIVRFQVIFFLSTPVVFYWICEMLTKSHSLCRVIKFNVIKVPILKFICWFPLSAIYFRCNHLHFITAACCHHLFMTLLLGQSASSILYPYTLLILLYILLIFVLIGFISLWINFLIICTNTRSVYGTKPDKC